VWADAVTTSDTGESSAGGEWTSAGRRSKRRRIKSNQQANGSPVLSQPSIVDNNCTTTIIPPAGMVANKNTSYASVAGKSVNKPVTKPQFKTIVGRSRTIQNSSNGQAGHISAAKPFISKATFCVDNVATSATVESMTQFVTAMDIDVIGCYEVNPRRSYWQRQQGIYPDDRKTFRVCIAKEDSGRFLIPKKWPAHISISQWHFKKTAYDGTLHSNGKNEAIINSTLPTGQSIHHSVAQQSMTSSVVMNNTVIDADKTGNVQLSTSSSSDHTSTAENNLEDMDETIITNNGE